MENFKKIIPKEDLRKWIILSGDGEKIFNKNIAPLLKNSKRYYRSTGYFSPEVFVKIGENLENLIINNGKMKLILGAHDLPEKVRKAQELLTEEKAKQILDEIGDKISKKFDDFVKEFNKRNIECLAWLLKNNFLEIVVAIPKKTYLKRGSGIFHEKTMIFYDNEDNIVSCTGSGNESVSATGDNGEKWELHFSWIDGDNLHIELNEEYYKKIWNGDHSDYYVFELPKALKNKIWEYYDKDLKQKLKNIKGKKSQNNLGDIARILNSLKDHSDFWHFSVGPVRLYPHQVFVANEAISSYPVRKLLCDEVGLGKTLEAGTIIKRLNNLGLVKRILILCPKNLSNQWKDEMFTKFNMDFYNYDSSNNQLISFSGKNITNCRNPFNNEKVNFVICSWHYARLKSNRSKLLESKYPFDLVIVDEAHAARKSNREKPTLLFELLNDLSLKVPNIVLLSATPIQTHPLDIHDLLKILGMGGIYWGKGENFLNYYKAISNPDSTYFPELKNCLYMLKEGNLQYVNSDIIKNLILKIDDKNIKKILERIIEFTNSKEDNISNFFNPSMTSKICKNILHFYSPVMWYMIRNNRKDLEKISKSIYNFPERQTYHKSIVIKDENIKNLRKNISLYIRKNLTKTFEELNISKSTIGFIKTIYWQRFCSSLFALSETFKHRKITLEKIIKISELVEKRKSDDWDWPDLESELDEEFLDPRYELINFGEIKRKILNVIDQELREYGLSRMKNMIEEEIMDIRNILEELERYKEDPLLDPKIQETIDIVKEGFHNNKKILLFSRYTDTIEIIKRALYKEKVLPCEKVAIFTGDGGPRFFIDDFQNETSVTKDDIAEGLDSGRLNLVLCSDAASEGLNLQGASVVLNVDIPWNPSRVEQRIGRADRLGHDPKIPVEVYYIWYSEQNLIERKMYEAIIKRQKEKKMILGTTQKLVNDQIEEAVINGKQIKDSAQIIEKKIDDNIIENSQLFKIINNGLRFEPTEKSIIIHNRLEKCIEKFLIDASNDINLEFYKQSDKYIFNNLSNEISKKSGRFIIGKSNYFSLSHPILEFLIKKLSEKYPIDKDTNIKKQKNKFSSSKIILEKNSNIKVFNSDEILTILENKLNIKNSKIINEKTTHISEGVEPLNETKKLFINLEKGLMEELSFSIWKASIINTLKLNLNYSKKEDIKKACKNLINFRSKDYEPSHLIKSFINSDYNQILLLGAKSNFETPNSIINNYFKKGGIKKGMLDLIIRQKLIRSQILIENINTVQKFKQIHVSNLNNKKKIEIENLANYYNKTSSLKDTKNIDSKKIPQADKLEEISLVPFFIENGKNTPIKLANYLKISRRHSNFLFNACRILDLVENNKLTYIGKEVARTSPDERYEIVKEAVNKSEIFITIQKNFGKDWYKKYKIKDISKFITECSNITKKATADRRAQTLFAWAKYVDGDY